MTLAPAGQLVIAANHYFPKGGHTGASEGKVLVQTVTVMGSAGQLASVGDPELGEDVVEVALHSGGGHEHARPRSRRWSGPLRRARPPFAPSGSGWPTRSWGGRAGLVPAGRSRRLRRPRGPPLLTMAAAKPEGPAPLRSSAMASSTSGWSTGKADIAQALSLGGGGAKEAAGFDVPPGVSSEQGQQLQEVDDQQPRTASGGLSSRPSSASSQARWWSPFARARRA